MKKLKIIIIGVVILILLNFAFKMFTNKSTPFNAEIYTITKSDYNFSYTTDGIVNSDKQMSVYSTTSGKVKKVYYRLWDSVEKGDVLLDIEESSISNITSNEKLLKLRLESLQKKYSLNQELYKNGLISQMELEASKLNYEEGKIAYNQAVDSKNKIELKVKAPISGVITELNADDKYTIDNTKALFKISDTENLKIVVSLSNSKIKNLEVGNKAYITSNSLKNNEQLEGHITSIEKVSTIDSQFNESVTKAIIKLNNNSILKPGDIVSVNIIYKSLDKSILLPIKYLSTDQEGNTIVYLVKDGIVKKQFIKLGITDGLNYEVLDGLSEGDNVLNNSLNMYKEGDKI